jgi:acyl carrier protein
MEIQNFLDVFASLFEVTPANELHADTEYKSLEEWDSMMALETIAMTDEEYDVELDGDDIRASDTISELFEIIKTRMNA